MCAAQHAEVWHVVQTQARHELRAAAAIEQWLRLTTFVPEVQQNRSGGVKRKQALFPGYFFVAAPDSGLPLSDVRRAPYVLRVVGFGGAIVTVESALVDALRQTVESINAGGGLSAHNFRPGDAVRLLSGPLAGLEAVFVGPTTPSQRVSVLLEFLGRQQRVEIAPGDLERVVPRPPRRTRGKGRVIRTHWQSGRSRQ